MLENDQGNEMKRNSRMAPVLVLTAALALAVGPAYPGGRDVPDAEDSGASETVYRDMPGPSGCNDAVAPLSVGAVQVDIRTDDSGRTTVTPTFLRRLGRLFSWVVGDGTSSDGSCPS